jgi:hypothetical protein
MYGSTARVYRTYIQADIRRLGATGARYYVNTKAQVLNIHKCSFQLARKDSLFANLGHESNVLRDGQ